MAVQEDDLASEQTLEKILKPADPKWENGSGTTKVKIVLPGSSHYLTMKVIHLRWECRTWIRDHIRGFTVSW